MGALVFDMTYDVSIEQINEWMNIIIRMLTYNSV